LICIGSIERAMIVGGGLIAGEKKGTGERLVLCEGEAVATSYEAEWERD